MALSNYLTHHEWDLAYFSFYMFVGAEPVDLSTHLRLGILAANHNGYVNWNGLEVTNPPENPEEFTQEHLYSLIRKAHFVEESSSRLVEMIRGEFDPVAAGREFRDWLIGETCDIPEPLRNNLITFLTSITENRLDEEGENTAG